jgi:2-polyprenyl-6-methoxyphenol hydroxylase-like FAD-dependent oxidoreductase
MRDFDAVVVGAGVAGCAATLELLSAGWCVGLLHQHQGVSAIESLSPAAVSGLKRLAISPAFELPDIVAWWGSDREVRLTEPGACLIERGALAESMRMAAVGHGAIVIDGTLLSIERMRNRWQLGCKVARDDERVLTATCLIDATGRASIVGRRLGATRVAVDQLFCLSALLRAPGLIGTWTESTCDGWWNLSSVPEQATASFYSSAATIRESKRDLVARFLQTRHLRDLLCMPVFGRGEVRVAGSSRLVPSAGPGWVSLGDATSTLQPLASAGVSKALRDTSMVSWALRHPADYERFQVAEFEHYLKLLAHHYALERRWPAAPFWESLEVLSSANSLSDGDSRSAA